MSKREDDSKIEWGKITRNIQYKDAPTTPKNDIPAPTGWAYRDADSGRFIDETNHGRAVIVREKTKPKK